MDPDVALKQIREILAEEFYNQDDYEFYMTRLGTLVHGLDEWLSKGGFLPKDWRR